MTTPRPSSPHFDRVVFTHGQGDIELTGSSLSAEGERAWEQRLLEHVRISHGERPATSFWYWYDEKSAVLLRRVRASGGDNRGDWCQGLVAAQEALTPWHALALYWWSGWDEQAGWGGRKPGPITAEIANAAYSAIDGALTGGAAARSAELVTLVAAALRDPWAPLAVLTERLQPQNTIELLWGLLQCTHLLFNASAENPLPKWTFSTFEVRHDTQLTRRPYVAFLPAEISPPLGAELVGTPISLSHPGPGDVATAKANELVSAYVQGGSVAVSDWMGARKLLNLPTVEARRAALLNLPAPASEGAADRPVRDRTPSNTMPATPPEVPLTDRSDLDLVRMLLKPRARHEVLISILAEVKKRGVAREGRPELRGLLLRGNFAAPLLQAELAPAPARHALNELVRFALQPEDFEAPRAVAALSGWLGDPSSAPPAVRALLDYAEEIERVHLLVVGAGRRYFYERGVQAIEMPESDARDADRAQGLSATFWQWCAKQPRPAQIGVAMLAAGNVLLFALLFFMLLR